MLVHSAHVRRIIARDEAGFTLTETLIAGLVMIGAIITIISLLEASVQALTLTNARSLANQVANEMVESARNYDYEQLQSTGTFPTDDDDLVSGSPPSYRDVDAGGNDVYRQIDYDPDTGLEMYRYVERKGGRFWIYTYVLWVESDGNPQAYKRVVVKVKWKTPLAGEVTMASNFAKEDSKEPRPGVSIEGVLSSNLNYFTGATQTMLLGAEDSIRGTVTLRVAAKNNSGKSVGIERVDAALYSPSGELKNAKSATSPGGSGYYEFTFDVGSTLTYPDSEGYVFVADAYDSIGGTQRDSMRVTIDNTAPSVVNPLNASTVVGSAMQNRITWDWTPAVGDGVPKISRFILLRKKSGTSGYSQIAALPSNSRVFIDASLEPGVSYWYRMIAVDGAGNWSQTGEKDRAPGGRLREDLLAPSVPTSVTAEPAAWNAVSVLWTASQDEAGGTGLSGYYIVASDGSGSTIVGQTGPTGYVPEYYKDYGLKGSATYTYWVKAYDIEGNVSSPGGGVQVTTPLR